MGTHEFFIKWAMGVAMTYNLAPRRQPLSDLKVEVEEGDVRILTSPASTSETEPEIVLS